MLQQQNFPMMFTCSMQCNLSECMTTGHVLLRLVPEHALLTMLGWSCTTSLIKWKIQMLHLLVNTTSHSTAGLLCCIRRI
jgi:hypothetical protein